MYINTTLNGLRRLLYLYMCITTKMTEIKVMGLRRRGLGGVGGERGGVDMM